MGWSVYDQDDVGVRLIGRVSCQLMFLVMG